jgi:hypothetical protein
MDRIRASHRHGCSHFDRIGCARGGKSLPRQREYALYGDLPRILKRQRRAREAFQCAGEGARGTAFHDEGFGIEPTCAPVAMRRYRCRALYRELHRVHERLVLASECTLGPTCGVQFG